MIADPSSTKQQAGCILATQSDYPWVCSSPEESSQVSTVAYGHIRPKALVKNPMGQIVAVEYARTLKSLRRYTEDIFPSHLRNIHAGVYHHVLWVSPTHSQHIQQLETIRKAVDVLTAQKRFFIDRNIVKGKVFHFTSANEFPQYEALSTR